MKETQQISLPEPLLKAAKISKSPLDYSSIKRFADAVVNCNLAEIKNSGIKALEEISPIYGEIMDLSGGLYWLESFISGTEESYKSGELTSHSSFYGKNIPEWISEKFPELSESMKKILFVGDKSEFLKNKVSEDLNHFSKPKVKITQTDISNLTKLISESLTELEESKKIYVAEFVKLGEEYAKRYDMLYTKVKVAQESGLIPLINEEKWQLPSIGKERMEKLVQLHQKRDKHLSEARKVDEKINKLLGIEKKESSAEYCRLDSGPE